MATNPDESFMFEPTASLPVLQDVYLEGDHAQYPVLRLEVGGVEQGIPQLPDGGDELTPLTTLCEQLEAAKALVADVLGTTQETITESDRTVAAQKERISGLEAELRERNELIDALARERQARQDWEAEALGAQVAREGLEAELLRRQTEIDGLRADRDALTHQLVELEARRKEQDELFCEFQDQLRDKDDGLAKLEARIARLALVDPAEQDSDVEVEIPAFGLLVPTDGPGDIEYAIGEPVETIGRESDNTIQIRESHVSRHHAQLVSRGNETCIEDLGSTNGIFVNGLRTKSKRLAHGDQVSVGSTDLRYHANPLICS